MSRYLPAIDILMCHLGLTFEEACEELGLNLKAFTQALDAQARGTTE